MTKKIVWVVIILVIIAGIAVYAWQRSSAPAHAGEGTAADYKNATYVLDGTPVTLVNGAAESPAAPGSASEVVTQYWGGDTPGDINGDGIPDMTFILTQSTGGSGTFYYVVAALGSASGGYQGTNGILLGDRIAPQILEYQDGAVAVNYAIRAATDPMTTQPSIATSTIVRVVDGSLVVAGA